MQIFLSHFNLSKNCSEFGLVDGLSGRVPAKQVKGPEFKPQYYKKKNYSEFFCW
jgi:hypothetical protein